MLFGSIISSPREVLSPTQALELANIYLDNARKTTDLCIALTLCHDTEASLSQAVRSSKHLKIPAVRKGIATAYAQLGWLLKNRSLHDEAEAFYKKVPFAGSVRIWERYTAMVAES
ncbi:MAG: hypothetical protein J3Q66DRAFT_375444 [Benniella sp.]|nr:MAG: hypothetical protein J3Q66DRAFT_375444 [Benniella sp.]